MLGSGLGEQPPEVSVSRARVALPWMLWLGGQQGYEHRARLISWKLVLLLKLSKVCNLGPWGTGQSSPGSACALQRLSGQRRRWHCPVDRPALHVGFSAVSSSRGLWLTGTPVLGGRWKEGPCGWDLSHLCQRLVWHKDPI